MPGAGGDAGDAGNDGNGAEEKCETCPLGKFVSVDRPTGIPECAPCTAEAIAKEQSMKAPAPALDGSGTNMSDVGLAASEPGSAGAQCASTALFTVNSVGGLPLRVDEFGGKALFEVTVKAELRRADDWARVRCRAVDATGADSAAHAKVAFISAAGVGGSGAGGETRTTVTFGSDGGAGIAKLMPSITPATGTEDSRSGGSSTVLTAELVGHDDGDLLERVLEEGGLSSFAVVCSLTLSFADQFQAEASLNALIMNKVYPRVARVFVGSGSSDPDSGRGNSFVGSAARVVFLALTVFNPDVEVWLTPENTSKGEMRLLPFLMVHLHL